MTAREAPTVPPKVTRAQKAAAAKTASVLVEALPYIRRFWEKIVVVKYGGNALHAPRTARRRRTAPGDALASFAEDVVLMRAVGMLPVVVHGGGPQIGALMERLGKETEFRNGLRVTDADTLDIARMVLVGKVNRDIVSAINVHGPIAVGMSGEDANLITAAPRHADLGFVGNVSVVDPTMLERLLAEGLIPVVATIGADESGQAYNINADTVAGALAEALQAEKLIFLTDIEGLRVVADDPTTVIHQASARGDRRDRPRRGSAGRHDPQGRGLRQRGAGRGRPGPHPRRAGAARAAARALHRLGRRDDGAAVTDPDVAAVDAPSERASLMRTYADPPATFVRGQGTVLYDADGSEYLDFITGLAVVSLGHAHPAVADAVAEQARTLSHVSNLYGNTLAPEVARTIDRLINGGTGQAGGQVFFANSGAEANECALKLARRWAGLGRHVVISADNAFHGRTLATLTATGQPEKQAPFLPLPEGFVHVPYDDVAALDKALDPDTVAAVLLEPLQGEGGVMVPSSDYLGAVRALCTERNALLMLDEVQTGLGRTGHWFAFQAQGLEPDVVTMAKALGNGMPVGACWARAEVAAAFGPGDHGSTFGGQPLALAAVKATLAVMESEDVCRRAREGGARLGAGLAGLPGVVSVRGAGLLLAAQLEAPVAKEAAAWALDARPAGQPGAARRHPRGAAAAGARRRDRHARWRILGEALAASLAGTDGPR